MCIRDRSRDESLAALQEAVVVIEGTGGNGTGFNISEDGLIVTNRHVVEDSRIITIRFGGDGAETFTTREWIDIPEVDMALIDIDGEDLPFVELNDEYPSADDEIIFIGNPLGYDWTISEAVSYTHLEDIDAILVTHEHSDHINRVAQLSKKYHIPVYASELTWESLPFYDDYFRWERHIFDYGMEIGDIGLDFFRLSHDAVQPVGLLLEHNGHQVGIATDTGMVTPSMYRKLSNVDGLVFEANHDTAMLQHGTYPLFLKQRVASDKGHLSNAQAAEALAKLAGRCV